MRRHITPLVLYCLIGLSSVLHADKADLRLLSGAARQAARGDTSTALEVAERFLDRPGRDEAKPVAMHLKGVLESGRGRTDTASAVLKDLILEFPRSDLVGRSVTELGMIDSRLGEDTLAIIRLSQVISRFPDSSFTAIAQMVSGRSADRLSLDSKALDSYLGYVNHTSENKPHLEQATQRSAELLYKSGRAEEAHYFLKRILPPWPGEGEELTALNQRLLEIGILTGLGYPDSALQRVEELRRITGGGISSNPRLLFLEAHALLDMGRQESADSLFSNLQEQPSSDIPADTLRALLMSVSLSGGNVAKAAEIAERRIKSSSDPQKSYEVFNSLYERRDVSNEEMLLKVADTYLGRFVREPYLSRVKLARAELMAEAGKYSSALKELASFGQDPGYLSGSESSRARLIAVNSYLLGGDTLRALADIRDLLNRDDGKSRIESDSLIKIKSSLFRSRGRYLDEAESLRDLVENYPASHNWQDSKVRLNLLEKYYLTDPGQAADQLLDMIIAGRGEVSTEKAARVSAEFLKDYKKAISLLTIDPNRSGQAGLDLIEYRFLSAFREMDSNAFGSSSELTQSWRDLVYFIGNESDKALKGKAVALLIDMYRSGNSYLTTADLRDLDNILRAEALSMGTGDVNPAALSLLGEMMLDSSAGLSDMMSRQAVADSARYYLTGAIENASSRSLRADASIILAESLENAGFAGARDSAAYIYRTLLRDYSDSHWAVEAALSLGNLYLSNQRYFMAYRILEQWQFDYPYAVDNSRLLASLGEASFRTERYSRAVRLLENEKIYDGLDKMKIRQYRYFLIRSLTETGQLAAAENKLIAFRNSYTEPVSQEAADVAAVRLYLAAGLKGLALSYYEKLDDKTAASAAASVFVFNDRLDSGEEPGRVRKDFERLRDKPWDEFFGIDPTYEAYQGIMRCYMMEERADKVEDARDDFRKDYPERRAQQAGLTLDEIEYLISAGDTQRSVSLYSDLEILFDDVYPRDRTLWIGARLAEAQNRDSEALKHLEHLSERYGWSIYGARAKINLAGLYLDAGRIDDARALAMQLKQVALFPLKTRVLDVNIEMSAGNWQSALERSLSVWADYPQNLPQDKILIDIAESARKTGRYRLAFEILESFWSPDDQICARARYMLAETYQNRGMTGRALQLRDAISSAFEGRSELALRALYQKAMMLESMGDIKGAVETYKELVTRAGARSDWSRTANEKLRELDLPVQSDSAADKSQQPSP